MSTLREDAGNTNTRIGLFSFPDRDIWTVNSGIIKNFKFPDSGIMNIPIGETEPVRFLDSKSVQKHTIQACKLSGIIINQF